MNAKTLIVYYSYTNNVHTIVSDLCTQIDADVIRIEPAEKGMPDNTTSKLMEQVHDALCAEFKKDPVAVLTGVYTGAGERNWVFYTRSVNIFGKKFNKILAPFELLPIKLYVEKDPEWNEYREMRLTEIADFGSDDD